MEPGHCRHLLWALSDYLDEEASDAICVQIDQHLADCPDCRAVVATLRRTVRLYHQLPQPGLPHAARERLYRSLDLSEFV